MQSPAGAANAMATPNLAFSLPPVNPHPLLRYRRADLVSFPHPFNRRLGPPMLHETTRLALASRQRHFRMI